MNDARTATIERKTGETEISIVLAIDGSGTGRIETGIPFFDHMLTLFARHSLADLTVRAQGDLEVDLHHTVEDAGIALGPGLFQGARRAARHPPLRLGLPAHG